MTISKIPMDNFFKKKDLIRIKRNISGNLLNIFSLFLIQLFYFPMMIYAWGIEKTGYWFYLLAIPSFLSFWKLNFSEASKQELIISKIKNKNEIYTISLLFTIITLFVFSIIYFSINLNFINYLKIFKDVQIYKFNWILFFIFLSFSTDIITNNLLTISQFKGKIYPTQIITSLFSILEKLIIPLAGFFTEYLLYAAIILFFLKLIRYVVSKFYVKKYISSLSLNFYMPNYNRIFDIFKKSTNFYFNDLAAIINVSGFIYFIGYFFTAEIVALITALNTLFKFLVIWGFSVFENVIRYEFANYYKKKNFINIIKLYKLQQKALYLILIIFLTIIFLIGEDIFNIWTNYSFNFNSNLIFLVSLETVVFLIGYNYILLAYSLNKLKKISLYGLLINLMFFVSLFYFETFRVNLERIYFVLIFKGIVILILNNIFNYNFLNYFIYKKRKIFL